MLIDAYQRALDRGKELIASKKPSAPPVERAQPAEETNTALKEVLN